MREQKETLLFLADKLYYKKQHKRVLEGRLEKKQFQYKCIPQKRGQDLKSLKLRLMPTIIISIIVLLGFIVLMKSFLVIAQGGGAGNATVGIIITLFFPTVVFGGYFCFRSWQHMIRLFCNVSNFKSEEEKLSIDMSSLYIQINELNHEIEELQKKYDKVKDDEADKEQKNDG